MKVLVIGSGGREHAICWKIAQNPRVDRVFCAPGNGGIEIEDKCSNLNITDIDELRDFASEEKVALTVVGPEVPLTEGIVDKFKEKGLSIFGPSSKAALLEGSKIYSKNFMRKYGIKTAEYADFDDIDKALEYIENCSYPVVVKADGLAAGKGVSICENYGEAKTALENFMIKDVFKGAGKKVIVEEFLQGVEASILTVTDGNTIIPFISSKDHKQIYDGGRGPNTGGMGAIAPNPYCSEEVLEDFEKNIMLPTLKGIQQENLDYTGIIFFGIMITKKGVYLLEYNVRMGDPETQAVLPLMKSDFVDLIQAAVSKKLSDFKLEWKEGACCCVVAASKGYPAKYETGFEINGFKKENNIFAAGVKKEDGVFKTSGGRVLVTYGIGASLEDAVEYAYENLKKVSFNGMYFRKDIGK
ncbi:phosphoribosylamine--glycine ligase [Clostridium luticellarii]|uniref:Phosphoribosylamine--glycine ligase n=1 Tax=Clostridium luticellarii TaxID=1691940 RepID=A0A2T0BJD9_9CLOT|nr:phosphoribosylamine--glycine ligase [Clostridium luticellarii]MCI1944072.1 phosphoribosylamine--glycine ligase [Clostridium luticellarii]MCI1967286.1 phosphoribosylamine--glycine ligase [Clostridium luticellarii]MCI1995198.1 phosphoribosylamine--glycine ligase [Clostridium luticellarii]MCI2039306.1 phosphoribosylamine--glycine ligase [Clostridium luticellarii]PRR84001.1 Phosphoribosylamine--glycine ligase [Clostridium luticellarii]